LVKTISLMASSEELADALAEEHAAYYRRNPKGEIVQACFIQPEEGDALVFACPWRSEIERLAVIAALRAAMIEHHAARYAFWSEVWTARRTVPAGTTMEQAEADFTESYTHGDIAADPHRIEAVFTLVVEGKGRMVTRLQRIVRGRNGGVRKLMVVDGGDDLAHMGGVLATLMPPRTLN
jgi:hypothetical protein